MSKSLVMIALVVAPCLIGGCGGTTVQVSGRVTCSEKPVVGLILLSPKAIQNGVNAGPSVTAPLDNDGRFDATLPAAGIYRIVITPNDVTDRPKPGSFDYPCDRTPIEREIKAGRNEIPIEMSKRTK